MLAIFHLSRKAYWFNEDLEIWARGFVIEYLHNWIMRTEMLSNPWTFFGFNYLIIEVITSFLMVKFAIVFQRTTLGSKKFIKNTYFLYNICNCFIGYKNWRYRWNFNVIQKVIQNRPIDFWICAFVIKNIIF